MSENKYRDYLSNDKTFYRQYLKREDEPVGSSSFTKVIMGAAATVGLAAGTAAAYRHGAFKGVAEKLIDNLGEFRQTRLGNTLDSVRNWTKDDKWDMIDEMDSVLDRVYARSAMWKELPGYLGQGAASREARQIERARTPIIQDKDFELIDYMKQFNRTLGGIEKRINKVAEAGGDTKTLTDMKVASRKLMDDTMSNLMAFNKEIQDNMSKRIGYHQATINDLWNHLPETARTSIEIFEKGMKGRSAPYAIREKVLDTNIFIKKGADGQPQFADLRDFRDAIAKTGDSLAEDFTTPFIKINPFRMFYANEFTKNKRPQIFADLGNSTVQPYVNKGLPMNQNSLFLNGKAYTYNSEINSFVTDKNMGYLVNARNEGQGSIFARNTKNMMNLYDHEFTPSEGWAWTNGKFGIRKNIWEPMAKFLDFGFQNERIGQDPALGDVAVYGSWIGKTLHEGFPGWKGIKPYQDKIPGTPAFGEGAEWLFVPRYKTLKEVNESGGGFKDYSKQFFAARNNPEDVTTASFFGYTFAERMNATINQMGFGLNAKHLGSAQQILWQLSLRRALPVGVGVEAYKAFNHLGEAAFGEEPEDAVAQGFVGSQIDIAKAAEAVGFTDWAKDMTKLMPGFDFIGELPVPIVTTEGMTPIPLKDLLPLDKTADELKDYYKNGEEGVRKGRYWETGNTPLVGSKVDYYQPNWYRRITSDWEYTETMWGSKSEYWTYHPKMPLLDPYHWEKKHYEDRPYQLTGGMPIIEEFPLIGPALNATVGQLVKPQQIMHEEEWNNPAYYQKKTSFQYAEYLGLIENNAGGAMTGGGVVGAHTGSSGAGVAQAATALNDTYGGGAAVYNPASGPNGITEGDHLAYVTSSGNVNVMQVDKGANLYNVNSILKTSGIGKTGVASTIRMEYPELSDQEAEALANPAGINMALGNIHYNMTEMGGFYGWTSTMVTDSKASQHDPRIQTSSKAYGFNRQFWDSDYGNMGADAMEIFRRFVPRDMHKNYVNTLDNNMPTWMPGAEYFTDYQHGDPYVKVKHGEMRLPGEAYEKLYNIDGDKAMNLDIGASFVGYDTKTIIGHWLHQDDIHDAAFQDILDAGTHLHKVKENEFKANGVSLKSEEFVENKDVKINGFYDMYADNKKLLEWGIANGADMQYYRSGPSVGTTVSPDQSDPYKGYYQAPETIDAKTASELIARSPEATVDIKTRGQKQFDKNELHFENAQQLNFYGTQLGTGVNAILEFNRDDELAKPHIMFFDTNPNLYQYTTNKVELARETVYQMMKDGAIGRGDLYGPLDRYRILADTAPYSDEFRKLKAQLSLIDLNDDEKKEIQIINKQVAARKDHKRTYDYHFKTANVKNVKVTVKEVLDNNTFLTEEFSDNPIHLAGVYVPTGKDEKGQAATDFVRQYLREGNKLNISINADEDNQINDDTYSTISAVVHAGDIGNINREMIKKGLAKEKENDWSATGVHARFSSGQIQFGSAWETFAHLDTPFHTKLLQVRSPLEQYSRREVYGKDWQDWGDPVNDYFIPWYQNWISKSPVAAVTLGTFMGSLFGADKNRYGRIMGAVIGGVSSLLGVSYVNALGAATGEKWVPERRRKERDIEEYFDILKFVKYRGLYEQASDEANKREGFDVRAYMKRNQMSGDARKTRLHQLTQAKRDLKTNKYNGTDDAVALVGPQENREALMKALNGEINSIINSRKAEKIGPIAAEAIEYFQESEKTMYAYDSGDPLANILAALPRKERLYINKFLKAPEEERGKILDVVPGYVKRVLQSMWGMQPDEKPDLYQYFSHHNLPGAGWEGWDPRANLSDVKLRVVKHEGMDMSEFNMWHEDEKIASQIQNDQVPQMIQPSHIGAVKNKLRDILGEAGFRDLNVEVEASKDAGIHMDVNVKKDRRSETLQQINDNGYSLI